MIVGQEKKMSDIVMHWEDLKSKLVTAKGKRIGKVVNILDDDFVIQNGRGTKYHVPNPMWNNTTVMKYSWTLLRRNYGNTKQGIRYS